MMVLVFVAGMFVGGVVGMVMMAMCAINKPSGGDEDVQEM